MSEPTDLAGSVAILGSGREGLAAYEYLSRQEECEQLEIITERTSGDSREQELLARGVLRVSPLESAELARYDILVRSPGVSIYRESLKNAAAAGVQITSPTSIWFGANPDARTIVITGTKGKSTTASLLAHFLRSKGIQVELAGNIGMPLLACDGKQPDWWVIELSSYQIADLEGRPSVGVIHNLDVDHLDWHGSEAQYQQDKLRLASLVKPEGLFVNADATGLSQRLESRPGTNWYTAALIDELERESGSVKWPSSLGGRHGRENVSACLAVMRGIGLDWAGVAEALTRFEGLPHRLQSLGVRDGVEYVNDSISSAPLATLAAIDRYSDRSVVLLLGGYERGIDWGGYSGRIAAHCPKAIVAMPDNGSRIVETLNKNGVRPQLGFFKAANMSEALARARRVVPDGGVILLSPGAPSFPHFRDYEERGEHFAHLCGFDAVLRGRSR